MFNNREEAGLLLSEKFKDIKSKDSIVLGIPRGGVVVAGKLAQKLNLPLDIVVVRKIGAPNNPELAIGAVGPKNTVYWDRDLYRKLDINPTQNSKLKTQVEKERKEKEEILRGNKPPVNLKGKRVLLVDDGIATGATVMVAEKYLRKEGIKEITLAVPVIGKETHNSIRKHFDKIVALKIEENFYAVGQFYREFQQVSDDKVIEILNSEF